VKRGRLAAMLGSPDSDTMTAWDNLRPRGKTDEESVMANRLVVVGIGFDPIEMSGLDLISGSRSVTGQVSGAWIDSQDTLAFSALTGVRPTIDTMPLERVPETFDKMMRNEALFRMVLTMGG
jgi:D-arabinose 1-dehydrogenase-like Zn-dependent alcohol dehydrogenase